MCAFTEQFAVDVSDIGDNQRKQLAKALGDNVFRTVVMMFVADFVPRVWAGFEALGLRKPGNGGAVDWDHDSDPTDALLNGFLPAVARMRGLDPVTTEVVRLRGAAQHNCRLCKSRRETNALDAGGTEDLYGEIEQYESADGLTDAHKAALRFVDALIWTPSQIGADVAAGVHEHFSEDQAFELTWDVMRNAANKIMVSLGGGRARWSRMAPSCSPSRPTGRRCRWLSSRGRRLTPFDLYAAAPPVGQKDGGRVPVVDDLVEVVHGCSSCRRSGTSSVCEHWCREA